MGPPVEWPTGNRRFWVSAYSRSSAIDARTTRHPGYSMSTKARMLSEKTFGWLKTYGGLRRTRFKGRQKTEQSFLLGFTTLNLLRIAKLTQP